MPGSIHAQNSSVNSMMFLARGHLDAASFVGEAFMRRWQLGTKPSLHGLQQHPALY